MKSIRYEVMVLAAVFLALACIASAQFSSDGTIAYMGDLSLRASSHLSDQSAKAVQATTLGAAAANATQNATILGNQTLNQSLEAISPTVLGLAKPADGAARSSSKGMLDLSAYAQDRTNNSLTGYTNIMYPISGARGTTASTSSGGGCCGGG